MFGNPVMRIFKFMEWDFRGHAVFWCRLKCCVFLFVEGRNFLFINSGDLPYFPKQSDTEEMEQNEQNVQCGHLRAQHLDNVKRSGSNCKEIDEKGGTFDFMIRRKLKPSNQVDNSDSSGLISSGDKNVPYFTIANPLSLLQLPCSAPPPRMHYATWWRSVTRRIMRNHFVRSKSSRGN